MLMVLFPGTVPVLPPVSNAIPAHWLRSHSVSSFIVRRGCFRALSTASLIWGYTSEQIAKAPLVGAGIATARVVNEREKPEAKHVPGTIFQFTPSLHSHNAYLQIWYETGVLGALLLLGLVS